MYAILGNIRFSGLLSPGEFESTKETNLPEIGLIENKPRLQRIGEALEKVTISMRLQALFCDPQAEYTKLDDARKLGIIMPLIMGDGTFQGEYVIRSLTKSVAASFPDGRPETLDVEAELIEYFEPDREATAQNEAISAGFANEQNTPLESVQVDVVQAPAASALADVNSVVASSSAVSNNLNDAVVNPARRARNMADTLRRLDDMGSKVQNAINTVNTSGAEIFAITRSLEANLTTTAAAIQNMTNFVAVDDLTGALTVGGGLNTAITSTRSSASALTAFNAAR
jgi:phage protein U